MVIIIAGDHKGPPGRIDHMARTPHKAMIEGIGNRERHIKATQFNAKGGKKDIHVGIDLSNLKKEGK